MRSAGTFAPPFARQYDQVSALAREHIADIADDPAAVCAFWSGLSKGHDCETSALIARGAIKAAPPVLRVVEPAHQLPWHPTFAAPLHDSTTLAAMTAERGAGHHVTVASRPSLTPLTHAAVLPGIGPLPNLARAELSRTRRAEAPSGGGFWRGAKKMATTIVAGAFVAGTVVATGGLTLAAIGAFAAAVMIDAVRAGPPGR